MGKVVNSRQFRMKEFPKLPPFRLIVVVLGILLVSLQGWIRLVLSLINWRIYESVGVLPGVWYLSISGLFSGSVYLAAAILALFVGNRYRRYTSFLLLAGLTGYWLDRIFVSISMEARTSLPFSLISSAGLTIAAIGLLYWDTIFQQTWNQEK